MTNSRRSFLQRTGLGVVGGAVATTLAAIFPEFAHAAAPASTLCGGSTGNAPCAARCKCNGYKDGKCMKLNGGVLACWCTDDHAEWHTAPSTCR
ncbi:twin-arginine translocation signal domain-containing protein [Nocardia sp. CA-128927]|uniref:twin-arginine translocation signal domain-containing protein n=1 Tax=Nocardia sp. CA-128927 TaxID=3239975 RepID=UPI003D955239